MKWILILLPLLSTSALAAETCTLSAGNRYEGRYDSTSPAVPGGVWVEKRTQFAELICQTDDQAVVRKSYTESELAGSDSLLGILNKLRSEGYTLVSCSGTLEKKEAGSAGVAPVHVLRETFKECLLTK